MRTTIRLDDALVREAKQEAARSGRSLSSFIQEALRETRARQRSGVELVTAPGKWIVPGVDLSNNAAVLDFMESERDARLYGIPSFNSERRAGRLTHENDDSAR